MLDAIYVYNLRSKPHVGRFIRTFMEEKSQITQNYRHFENTHNTSGTSSSTQFWSRHRQTTLCLINDLLLFTEEIHVNNTVAIICSKVQNLKQIFQ